MVASNFQRFARIFLLVAICYSAADLTAARIERRLQVPAEIVNSTTTNVTTTTGPPPQLANVGDLQNVLSTTAPPAPPPGSGNTTVNGTVGPAVPGQPAPVAVPTGPPPRLTGTLAGGGHSLAVLLVGNETRVLGIGEEVNGYTITDVGQFSVTVRDGSGNVQTLTMDLANMSGNSTAVPQAPQPIQNISPGPIVANTTMANATAPPPGTLSSKQLKDMLNNAQSFADKIQVKGIRRNDEVVGMQVNYTNQDNPFAKLGIQAGDVITSFNGHPLKGPEDLTWAYGELRNAQQLNFQIERGGTPMPLQIQLTE